MNNSRFALFEEYMNRNEMIPVVTVSLLLLVYCILILTGTSGFATGVIFFLSPLFIGWMVVNVIRQGEYKGRTLEDDQEWGYSGRDPSL